MEGGVVLTPLSIYDEKRISLYHNLIKEISATNMRILLLGGHHLGCEVLEYLQKKHHTVTGVIVNKDEFSSHRWFPSMIDISGCYNIPTFYFENINSKGALKIIRQLRPDLILCAYYHQILKRELLELPPKGCVNFHFGIAEEYRGCYSNTWAIINGEKYTGMTVHYMSESIDVGDIIGEKKIRLKGDETARDLYDKLTKVGVDLLRIVLPKIVSNSVSRRQQITTEKTKYYKRVFPDQKVDFSKSGKEIYDFIRAVTFAPFPPAYFFIGKRKMIIIEEKELKKT